MSRVLQYSQGLAISDFWYNLVREAHQSGLDPDRARKSVVDIVESYGGRFVPGTQTIVFERERDATLFLLRYS